jgi:hypothetical protein
MNRFALFPLIALSPIIFGQPVKAQDSQEILVDARHLDKVENPSEIGRWQKVLSTPEVQAIGDAVTTAYGCVGCYSMVATGVNTVVPLSNAGNDHKGVIQAPVGYTVCRAYAKDPSLNCDGTLTGSYRTADDPGSGGYDGLHWYIVVPTPGIGKGSCWVEATIVVEFLRATPGNRSRHNCAPSGTMLSTMGNRHPQTRPHGECDRLGHGGRTSRLR